MKKININSRHKRGRRFRSRYASAALCIAAVAIAACAVVVRMQKDGKLFANDTSSATVSSKQSQSDTSSWDETDKQVEQTSQTPISEQDNQTSSKPPVNIQKENPTKSDNKKSDEYEDYEDSEETLAIQTIAQNGNYVRAVGGAITKDYCMTSLVYSKTTGDWRVHNGLDLSANIGEIVKSAGEGTVAGILEDPMYGTTVVINQNDGLMVYYRGLSKDTAVRQGENIAAGATIGTVGELPCESGDGSHIHIEVMRDNKYLNPSELLGYK